MTAKKFINFLQTIPELSMNITLWIQLKYWWPVQNKDLMESFIVPSWSSTDLTNNFPIIIVVTEARIIWTMNINRSNLFDLLNWVKKPHKSKYSLVILSSILDIWLNVHIYHKTKLIGKHIWWKWIHSSIKLFIVVIV